MWPEPTPGQDVRGRGEPVPTGADDQLATAMDAIRRLASLARAARESGKLRVRQPLARMQVAVPAQVQGPVFETLLEVLRAEVNVKRIEIARSDTELVRLRGKANFRALGKRYGKDTPRAAGLVDRLQPDELRTLEAGGQVTRHENGLEVVYFPGDVIVEREVVTAWLVASDGPFVAALDPTLDADLIQEGLARELVHLVQRLRKEAGFAVSDRIDLGVDGPVAVLDAARAHREFIMTETLSRRLETGQAMAGAESRQRVDLEGYQVALSVRRHPTVA
jgi:isoleucyl-tRNA synthetase